MSTTIEMATAEAAALTLTCYTGDGLRDYFWNDPALPNPRPTTSARIRRVDSRRWGVTLTVETGRVDQRGVRSKINFWSENVREFRTLREAEAWAIPALHALYPEVDRLIDAHLDRLAAVKAADLADIEAVVAATEVLAS